MKTFFSLAILFLATTTFAGSEVMYCQYWNSHTHSPEALTISADKNTSGCVSQPVGEKNTSSLDFCMSFNNHLFSAELSKKDSQGKVQLLKKYVKDMTSETLENFIITGATEDGYYTSALCSPQN